MNEVKTKSYSIRLRVKDHLSDTLPYHINGISISVKADNLIDACEKAEVYFSGALGVSLVTENAFEEYYEAEIEPEELDPLNNDILDE